EVDACRPLAACDQPLIHVTIRIEPENVARCVVIEIAGGSDLRARWVSSWVYAGAPVCIGEQPYIVIAGRWRWWRRRRRRRRCAGLSYEASAGVVVAGGRCGIVGGDIRRARYRRVGDCRVWAAAVLVSLVSEVVGCVVIADDLPVVVDAERLG